MSCFSQYLHSIMFLLIQKLKIGTMIKQLLFTFHYVSINTRYLAIFITVSTLFTFHYVSINT